MRNPAAAAATTFLPWTKHSTACRRNQLLQPRVLIAQPFRFLSFAHIHAAILRLPGIDRVRPHAHLAGYVLSLAARLHQLDRSNHLLRIESLDEAGKTVIGKSARTRNIRGAV